MGLLDKIIRKSAKSTKKHSAAEKKSVKKEIDEKEPTIAQLKEQSEKVDLTKPGAKKVAKTVKKDDTKNAYRVLIKPMVTEKGTYLASQNKYIFEVAPTTNKVEIKKAIQALYGVTPLKVNLIPLAGKKVRYGRVRGRTKDRKKAIITLAQGQTIEVYKGV